MKRSTVLKNTMMFLMCSCLFTTGISSVYADEESDGNDDITSYVDDSNIPMEDATLNSDGEYYELPSMDADGNITMVKIPEVKAEEIEQEKMAQADSFDVVMEMNGYERVIGTFDTLEEAQGTTMMRSRMFFSGTTTVRANTDYSNLQYGVVDFHTKSSNINTSYTETGTGFTGYLNGSYGADAAFLGYCSTDKSKIKFRMAGVEGCVNASDVIVRDAEDAHVSFYRVEKGKLLHYLKTDITSAYYPSTLNVGLKQSYMEDNVVYFSYDGHYFYKDFEEMIDDYKNDTYEHSINPSQPYYNYFQFLSHRSKTDVTAEELDEHTSSYLEGMESKMNGLGSAFIENQNKYGANALLMYGVAVNESYWGTSSIALEKNNLFGHNATDFNPSLNANRYDSPKDSVEHHAKNYVSDGYLDPKDAAGRYYGAHLGDKSSGMNVKYASDPYWGEKAASIVNNLSQKKQNKDLGKYQIGIVNKGVNLQVRKEATTSSTVLYNTKGLGNYPIIVLSKTNGENVGSNSVWYKIQSDPTLNGDRSASTQSTYTYDYDKMYAYVSSAYVNLVSYTNVSAPNIPESPDVPNEESLSCEEILSQSGYRYSDGYISGFKVGSDVSAILTNLNKIDDKATYTIKNTAGTTLLTSTVATGQTLTITAQGKTLTYHIVVYGDPSGDGKITSMDYVLIKNHILKIKTLSGSNAKAADVNQDGKITSMDYVLIKNHILGISAIK